MSFAVTAKRRSTAVERDGGGGDGGGGRDAARFDAERESGNALRPAGIDPAGGGFAFHPTGKGAVCNRGGVIPQPAPSGGEHDNNRNRRDDGPQPPAWAGRGGGGTPQRHARRSVRIILSGDLPGIVPLGLAEYGVSKTRKDEKRREKARRAPLCRPSRLARRAQVTGASERGRWTRSTSTKPGTFGCSATAR